MASLWLSAKSLHRRIQKEHLVIVLNLLYSLKVGFTRAIHFISSDHGVRKFSFPPCFSLARVDDIINIEKKQRNWNWDKSDLETDISTLLKAKGTVHFGLKKVVSPHSAHLNSTIHLLHQLLIQSPVLAKSVLTVTPQHWGWYDRYEAGQNKNLFWL